MASDKLRRRSSAAVLRSREMMMGGLVAAHVVGLSVTIVATILDGIAGLLTCMLGFAAVVIFYSVGQWLEIIASELEPKEGMALVLVSYGVRVIGIAAGLWSILSLQAVAPYVIGGWLVGIMTATVLAWVGGVVLVGSRQRVPIYDFEDRSDSEGESS